ncbi:MAG: hypothetical protein HKN25_12695 [Pyrinomonadaceae bacterium]|nr:hypothetical protein [Pyrinomonadaceae bacterium]
MRVANGFWRTVLRRPKRKLEITTKRTKTLQIRRLSSRVLKPCPECGEDTVYLSPNEAQSFFETDMDHLDPLLRAGLVHRREIVNAELQVCFRSLKKVVEHD